MERVVPITTVPGLDYVDPSRRTPSYARQSSAACFMADLRLSYSLLMRRKGLNQANITRLSELCTVKYTQFLSSAVRLNNWVVDQPSVKLPQALRILSSYFSQHFRYIDAKTKIFFAERLLQSSLFHSWAIILSHAGLI